MSNLLSSVVLADMNPQRMPEIIARLQQPGSKAIVLEYTNLVQPGGVAYALGLQRSISATMPGKQSRDSQDDYTPR